MRQLAPVAPIVQWIVVVSLLSGVPPAWSAEEAAENPVVKAAAAVVGLRVQIPLSARTARRLGTEREGNGVVIDDNGLILTIGYLTLEANRVAVVGPGGRVIPAKVLGYDAATGFGILRSSAPLGVKPLRLGQSRGLNARDPVLVVASGDKGGVHPAVVASRREFAGYWEYLLDRAIFTMPPIESFAGAALLDKNFHLVGIGSLFVSDALGTGVESPGNMFVPIDQLKPVLADLLAKGRSSAPPRPWLGVNLVEQFGRVIVTRVSRDGPAKGAGLEQGDIILEIAGQPVAAMGEFYRKLWRLGQAGVDVPLKVLQGNRIAPVTVKSRDRYSHYRFSPGP